MSSQKEYGSEEVCFLYMMAYQYKLGNTDVSRQDIKTFFETLPDECKGANPRDHKATADRKNSKTTTIEKAKYDLIVRGSLKKETLPGKGKKYVIQCHDYKRYKSLLKFVYNTGKSTHLPIKGCVIAMFYMQNT